jgi:formate-dependent nitrite reductase membrane component NrfD
MGPIALRPLEGSARGSRTQLLPAIAQTLWGWPAVLNFVLGGLGAGFYVMAAVTAAAPSPALRTAAWLGPLLVLGGFAAVAGEAGRPGRGPRVLARVRTSWMSRELWLGGAFALLAATGLLVDGPGPRGLATAAAVGLTLAQGEILRHARGVTVWAARPVPIIFLTSALVSGAGLLVVLAAWRGQSLDPLLGAALVVLIAHVCAWSLLVAWSRDDAFRQGVRPLREGPAALGIVVGGCVLPSLLAAVAVALPRFGPPLAAAAGALMVAGQGLAKAVLVLRAGHLRPISLTLPPLPRRSP